MDSLKELILTRRIFIKKTCFAFLALVIVLEMYASLFAQDKIVYHIPINGTINPRVSSNVGRSIRDAEHANANAIILEINTFGGELEAATRIRDYILDTNILTIAFINKRAISAGALISLASEKIVVSPGATIGAATPVNFLGEKASEKIISYWRNEMKSTAEVNNRLPKIAEAMVDEEVEISGLIEKEKVLTLTTREALNHKIADFELESIDDILESFDLVEARVVSTPTSSVSLFMQPSLIWLLIGLVLFVLEFANPGFITFFFGIGAWIVAIVTFVTDISINIQLVIFIIASLVLIVSLRKWIKSIFVGHITSKQIKDEMPEEFVGEKAIVSEQIIPNLKGRVEFRGSTWDAESDESILEGSPVEIIGKDTITLKVKSLNRR